MNKHKFFTKKHLTFWNNNYRLFVYVLSVVMLSFITPSIIKPIIEHLPSHAIQVLAPTLSSMICYAVPFLLFSSPSSPMKKSLSPKQSSLMWVFLPFVGIIGVTLCYLFRNLIVSFAYALLDFRIVNLPKIETIYHFTFSEAVFSIIGLVILTPLFEELFFRAVLCSKEASSSKILRILASSLCFISSAHAHPSQLLTLIPFSLVCAYSYIQSDCIFVSLSIHVALNLSALFSFPWDDFPFSFRIAYLQNDRILAILFVFLSISIGILMFILFSKLLEQFKSHTNHFSYSASETDQRRNPASYVAYTGSCAIYLVFSFVQALNK